MAGVNGRGSETKWPPPRLDLMTAERAVEDVTGGHAQQRSHDRPLNPVAKVSELPDDSDEDRGCGGMDEEARSDREQRSTPAEPSRPQLDDCVERDQRGKRCRSPHTEVAVERGCGCGEAKPGERQHSAVARAAERPKCNGGQSQSRGGRRKYPCEPAVRRALAKRERQRQHRRSVDKGEVKAREPIARDAQFRG